MTDDIDRKEPPPIPGELLDMLDRARYETETVLEGMIGEVENARTVPLSNSVVVGKDAASLDVDKWYQGSAADVEGGKATLYVFWEVWCPHCKREVPKLSATYDKFKGQGLTIENQRRPVRRGFGVGTHFERGKNARGLWCKADIERDGVDAVEIQIVDQIRAHLGHFVPMR